MVPSLVRMDSIVLISPMDGVYNTMWLFIHTPIYICICIYIRIHTYMHVHTYVYVCVCVYAYVNIYIPMHINIHIHMYIYTYCHTSSSSLLCIDYGDLCSTALARPNSSFCSWIWCAVYTVVFCHSLSLSLSLSPLTVWLVAFYYFCSLQHKVVEVQQGRSSTHTQ